MFNDFRGQLLDKLSSFPFLVQSDASRHSEVTIIMFTEHYKTENRAEQFN